VRHVEGPQRGRPGPDHVDARGRSGSDRPAVRSAISFGRSWCTKQGWKIRRAAPRQEAYVSAGLETSTGRSTIAITRDISSRGLLILTRATLTVGEVIKLTFALGDSHHTLSGKVVRVEGVEPHELWRYKVAISVDDSEPSLAELDAMLAAAKQ